MDLEEYCRRAIAAIGRWEATWGPVPRHPALDVGSEQLDAAFEQLTKRLEDNYPFFHPRYAGQMLKPPHPVAVVGYLAAMLINPNNHALDGGPATAAMEKEVVRDLAAMFRLPAEHLGHLTTSGTVANLEALFVARELHPGQAVAVSADAHYTHERMGHVLGLDTVRVPTDDLGRIDLDALEGLLRAGGIGTVVVTAGTTGLGAIDRIDEVLALRERYGCRVHVDAAYGGFFTILAWADAPAVAPAPFRAIGECDSVVVDPHKHGLQPYGCGAVLFRDPSVGRFYRHDSPYTYFTSEELHLGEISLECSRAGAAAAALWLTLQVFPLRPDGLGAVLAAGRRAALHWAGLLGDSDVLAGYLAPELDIVTYFPRTAQASASAVDAASQRVLELAMTDDDPVFLSTLKVAADQLATRLPLERDAASARILRSVLMRPSQEPYVEELHERVERFARRALAP